MASRFGRGDVVLAPFPFSDLSGSKVRPALVVSSGTIGNDVILVAISSIVRASLVASDFLLETTHSDFPATGLKVRSVFRAHNLTTIEASLILRRLGRINASLQREIDDRLRIVLTI